MITSFSELIAAGALRTAAITVCGEELTIRELSVAQRNAMVEQQARDPKALAVFLVQTCAVAPDGSALVSPDQAAQLAELRPDLVDGIAGEVVKLSGLVGGKGAAKND